MSDANIPMIIRDEVASSLRQDGKKVGILHQYPHREMDAMLAEQVPVLHYNLGKKVRVIVRFDTSQAEVFLLSEQNCCKVGAAEYADPQFLEKLRSVLDSCHGRNAKNVAK